MSYCNWCGNKFTGTCVIYKGYHQRCWDANKSRIRGETKTLEERVELLEEHIEQIEIDL